MFLDSALSVLGAATVAAALLFASPKPHSSNAQT
jgi:hypothetical protein